MAIKAEEISALIKEQIENYTKRAVSGRNRYRNLRW